MSIVDVEIVQVFLSENIPSFRLYLKERERDDKMVCTMLKNQMKAVTRAFFFSFVFCDSTVPLLKARKKIFFFFFKYLPVPSTKHSIKNKKVAVVKKKRTRRRAKRQFDDSSAVKSLSLSSSSKEGERDEMLEDLCFSSE